MMPVEVEIRGLTKRFGSVDVVRDLTFEVGSGRVTAFLGPNGAGKTTTLRMLLGLVRPSAGEALIGGRRYSNLERPREVVGAAIEGMAAHPGHNALKHLRTLAGPAGAAPSRIDEVLEQVGLAAARHQRIGGYSLGMRQRLGLAAALLGDPRVLVLDEPANGLDPAGMAWLRRLLRELAADGRTVLMSSHVLSEVEQTADDIVIINAGRLGFAGSLDDLSRGDGSLEQAFLRLTGTH